MTFRSWTKILPVLLIEKWARSFEGYWITFKGEKYVAFPLYRDMLLLIVAKKYEAEEKSKEEKREKKLKKAELKFLELASKYPELKDKYFQKDEEDDYDE